MKFWWGKNNQLPSPSMTLWECVCACLKILCVSYCGLLCRAAGVQSDSDSSAVNNKLSGQCSVKPNRPSLAKILLSLDGNLGKQQALSHVLSALQIMYAR